MICYNLLQAWSYHFQGDTAHWRLITTEYHDSELLCEAQSACVAC